MTAYRNHTTAVFILIGVRIITIAIYHHHCHLIVSELC